MSITWQIQTRALVKAHKSWKPCLCIQGGGAKGAWEAGVLAGLSQTQSTSTPVALWGTSAGALNALWTSTTPTDQLPKRLISNWIELGHRIRISIMVISITMLGLTALTFKFIPITTILILLSYCAYILFISLLFGSSKRLPGLLPISLATFFLPKISNVANYYTYLCTADVSQDKQPENWTRELMGVFTLEPASTEASIFDGEKDVYVSANTAAMSSAALPILFNPLKLANKELLDGGLEANLPAEFILRSGAMGGHSVFCIIPRPINDLDPNDHADRRVLNFLDVLIQKQQYHRNRAETHSEGAWTGPSHTLHPVIVIAPNLKLKSGLLRGFFSNNLMRYEFALGKREAKKLIRALSKFEDQDDSAIDNYLLENQKLNLKIPPTPKYHLWYAWANKNWFHRNLTKVPIS